MIANKGLTTLKISSKDVAEALQMWLNDGMYSSTCNIKVLEIKAHPRSCKNMVTVLVKNAKAPTTEEGK